MGGIKFWQDPEKRKVDPMLFSKKAEDLALEINGESGKGRINKRTQIRKFYDEVVRLSELARVRTGEWENILPMVHMLSAKAAYARGRNLVSEGFLKFIKGAVDQVERPEDLKVFSNFFEAFMGFYRLHGPRN